MTACVWTSTFLGGDNDRDVARTLVDTSSTALCTSAETLERHALIHIGLLDVQVVLAERLAGLVGLDALVGDGALQDLEHRQCSGLRTEDHRSKWFSDSNKAGERYRDFVLEDDAIRKEMTKDLERAGVSRSMASC